MTERDSEEVDDDTDEHEDRDENRDNYWRAQIVIVGHGEASTANGAFDCTSDGVSQQGECGPTLVRFKELDPPLLRAIDVPGWTFDRWKSTIREPNGESRPRQGPLPDGSRYMNGFGYSDTGELETVTAIFVSTKPD